MAPTARIHGLMLVLALAPAAWAQEAPPPADEQLPRPPGFARAPRTAEDLWEVVDYYLKNGEVDPALPYYRAFLAKNPGDDVLARLRDEYGIGSFLRLQDFPATAGQAEALVMRVVQAGRAQAVDPAEIHSAITALAKTPEEVDVALGRLRQAGPYAIPAMVEAIVKGPDAAAVARAMGRLDRSAVPALWAVLDAPPEAEAAAIAAASALGTIGDPRSTPFLVYPVMQTARPAQASAAIASIEKLTGKPLSAQPLTPVRLLTAAAKRYLFHQVPFEGEPAEVWSWPAGAPAPVVKALSRSDAEEAYGTKLARQALQLDPADREAQVVLLGLELDKAVGRAGPAAFLEPMPKELDGVFAKALQSGPILGDLMRLGMAGRLPGLTALAARAYRRTVGRDVLLSEGTDSPLVQGLTDPDRRVQFASARGLIELEPQGVFAGSSRVVPILARFLSAASTPRAVTVAGAVGVANELADLLKKSGYTAEAFDQGAEAFRAVVNSSDVEMILIAADSLQGDYRLGDLMRDLRADSRSAGIPIFLVGSDKDKIKYTSLYARRYPRVGYLVAPTSPELFRSQLERGLRGMGLAPLSSEERQYYARTAAELLARAASTPKSPFRVNLDVAGSALIRAASSTDDQARPSVLAALAEVPTVDAQRRLADAALDPSKDEAARIQAAELLGKSLQRFGSLLANAQEYRLLEALAGDASPAEKVALAAVIGAMKPSARSIGERLRQTPPPRP